MSRAICRTLVVVSIVWVVWVPAGIVCADEADDQFAVAAGHYDRQQWKLAAEEFQTFLTKYPHDRRASQCVFFRGEALLQLGKLDDARGHFHKYATEQPDGKYARAALFRSGEAAYLAANFAAAKPDLERFLAKYPKDRLIAYVVPYLGDIALAGNDLATAVGHFRDGLARFPDGPMQDDCRFGLGRALEKQNQREEAERLYLAVARKSGSPLADAAQFHLGALQYAAGRYDQALESLSTLQQRSAAGAWQPNARLWGGLTLLKLNRPAEAVKQFDAVLATASAGDELLQQAARGKAQAALQVKDYTALDRAAADFEKRFPSSSIGADVRRMLVRSLIERKQYARAAAMLEPMVGSKQGGKPSGQPELENRYLLAASYEGLKRYEEALAALLPVVDAAEGQLKADAQLTYGSLLLAQKKYAEAIAPLEAFQRGKPQGEAAVKAAGELAVCYARSGRLDKAKQVYAELVQKNQQHPLIAPTTELLAEAAYAANEAAWSAELWTRLATAGNSAEYGLKGKLGLGWSQFKAGKLPEAAATFAEVLKGDPPEAIAVEAALVRGRILEQLGQNEPALAMFNLVVDKYPASKQRADALLSAARLCEKLKQNQQAAAIYQRLANEYPQLPQLDAVLYQWAWVLQDLNRPEEAARLFERLHKERSQSRFWADATYRLAEGALNAKRYDAANALADELLKSKAAASGGAEQDGARIRQYAMFLRGQIAVAKADWPKVREAFEALLKEFPDSQRRPVAEFWIAESYYRQGDYAAAGGRFERLAGQAPQKREPWMAMIALRHGQVLAQRNQWSEAQAVVAPIGADFPGFEQQYEVDYLLGRCLANAADFDGARQAYNRVIQSPTGAKTETAAMAQWMIGETFFHQKNYEAAKREYLRLEILYAYPTWQAGALLQAGKCDELLGERTEASKLYQRILKTYPNTSFAGEAEQRLKAIGKVTSAR
jgi:cellulose synthase operon protein C